MKAKRIFALMAALLLMLTILVACSTEDKIIIIDNEKQKDDVTALSFFGYKADEINLIAIEHALHAFMKEHSDITVNYEGIKGTTYWNALELRYNSDKAGGFAEGILDDVIMVDQGRLTSMGSDLADLSDVVDANMFNDFIKSQMLQADGTIKFMPMSLGSYCLFVNHDMLRADGQPVPQNLLQLREVCNFYVSQKHINPIICNNNNSLRTVIEACGLYVPNGNLDIDAINRDPSALANLLYDGFALVDEMIKSGWIDAAATLTTSQTSGDLAEFVKGEAPFMITGGWVSLRIKDMLAKAGKTMDFGVYAYPVKNDGCVLLVNVTTCISVNVHSANLDKAKTFVSYFVNPDSVWEYCDTQCCFSPLKNETRMPSEPTVAPTAEYYSNGRAVIGADFRLDVPLDLYLTDCTLKMLQGATLEETTSYFLALLNGEQTLD